MKTRLHQIVTVTSVLTCGSFAVAGPDWTELGDAGSDPRSAQIPLGDGDINSLSGNLGDRGTEFDFEDMYYFGVSDPGSFSLSIAVADFDAQLFVFHITNAGAALGLLANDDMSEESSLPMLTSMATDGTGVVLDLPGDYLVAVAGRGRNPISSTGLIFDMASPTEISGADGPGGLNRLIGWEGEGETGSYRIDMTGTVFPEVPAPSSLALLGLAGFAARRRR